MRNVNRITLALFACIVMFGALSATAYASDFGTFQHDNYHTGVTTDSAPIATPTANWATYGDSYYGYAGFDVAPIVGGDKTFEVSYNGTIFAFNKTTGAIAWVNSLLSGNGTFELATPAYNNGILYVALSNVYTGPAPTWAPICTNTSISAINANTGAIIWTKQVSLNGNYLQTDTPVSYDNGKVYFGTANVTVNSTTGAYYSDYGAYYCYNANTGNRIWVDIVSENPPSGYYWAGAAIIGNYVVYGDGSNYLLSVNKNTGSLVNYVNITNTFNVAAGGIESSISYDQNRVFFTSQGGYCFALGFNTNNGRFNTASKWSSSIGYSTSTPAVYDGKVFVGIGNFNTASGDNLVCLSESNGAVLWSASTNGAVQSSPVVSVNQSTGAYYVYFTTNVASGTVYCVNSTGATQWTYLPPAGENNYILQGVAISDGWAYFGNDAGYVFGLHQ